MPEELPVPPDPIRAGVEAVENALLLAREALEAVEFAYDGDSIDDYCRWCVDHDTDVGYKYKGHAPDCLRERALAAIREVVG